MPITIRARLFPAAVAAVVALTGCGSDATSTPTAAASTDAAPATVPSGAVSTGSRPTAAPPSVAAVDREIVVRVAGKKVTPPTGRVEVHRGATVRITVTSDVADDLHVHGYDLKEPLPAGQPASIDFRADRSGLFEVETHDTHLVLFQLLVR